MALRLSSYSSCETKPASNISFSAVSRCLGDGPLLRRFALIGCATAAIAAAGAATAIGCATSTLGGVSAAGAAATGAGGTSEPCSSSATTRRKFSIFFRQSSSWPLRSMIMSWRLCFVFDHNSSSMPHSASCPGTGRSLSGRVPRAAGGGVQKLAEAPTTVRSKMVIARIVRAVSRTWSVREGTQDCCAQASGLAKATFRRDGDLAFFKVWSQKSRSFTRGDDTRETCLHCMFRNHPVAAPSALAAVLSASPLPPAQTIPRSPRLCWDGADPRACGR